MADAFNRTGAAFDSTFEPLFRTISSFSASSDSDQKMAHHDYIVLLYEIAEHLAWLVADHVYLAATVLWSSLHRTKEGELLPVRPGERFGHAQASRHSSSISMAACVRAVNHLDRLRPSTKAVIRSTGLTPGRSVTPTCWTALLQRWQNLTRGASSLSPEDSGAGTTVIAWTQFERSSTSLVDELEGLAELFHRQMRELARVRVGDELAEGLDGALSSSAAQLRDARMLRGKTLAFKRRLEEWAKLETLSVMPL